MKIVVFLIFLFSLSGQFAFAQFEDDEVVSTKITPSDYKKLSAAMKSNSEDKIVAAVADILGRNSKDLKALNALGVYYFKTKRLGMAKIIFERALKNYYEEPALHNNLGIIYMAEGDTRAAISYFRKAISFDSDHSQSTTNLSSIFLEYRDYSKALSPLEDSYDNLKSDLGRGDQKAVEVASNYAVALMGVGEAEKSKKVFERILEGETKSTDIQLNYAILLVELLKDKSEATKVLNKIKFLANDSKVLKRVNALEQKLSTLK